MNGHKTQGHSTTYRDGVELVEHVVHPAGLLVERRPVALDVVPPDDVADAAGEVVGHGDHHPQRLAVTTRPMWTRGRDRVAAVG